MNLLNRTEDPIGLRAEETSSISSKVVQTWDYTSINTLIRLTLNRKQ